MFASRMVIGALLCLFLLFSRGQNQSLSSQDSTVIEWNYLLKVFHYDRNYKKRSASSLNILIVHERNDVKKLQKTLLLTAKNELGRTDVHVSATRFKSVGRLLRQVKNKDITLIYIDPSAAKKLSSILQVTRGLKIPSLTYGRRLVKSGVSVGIFHVSGKTRLVINRTAAIVEGIRFASSLFAIATLIQ